MVATISALPTPPTTSDPSSFDARADAFVASLVTFVTEANALAEEVNTLAAQVASDASAVADAHTDIIAARADVTAKATQVTADKNASAASAAAAAASAAAAAGFDPSSYLAKADNLASVASKPQAIINLGLRIGTKAVFTQTADPGSSAQENDVWIYG